MYLGGGLLLDKLGTRRGFLCIMILWSLACASHDLAGGVIALFTSRRRPGDVHVHYFGACALSFGDGVQLADGDVMEISFASFGRALCNPLRVARGEATLVAVKSLA